MTSRISDAKDALFVGLSGQVRDSRVLSAMARVPRELFVPPELRSNAYSNAPLPIGYDQTISQPLMTAHMTSVLQPAPTDRVLEVGTGSGYQAAILGLLAHRGSVVTVERIPVLARHADELLRFLGLTNVQVRARRRHPRLSGKSAFRRHSRHRRRTPTTPIPPESAGRGRKAGNPRRQPRLPGTGASHENQRGRIHQVQRPLPVRPPARKGSLAYFNVKPSPVSALPSVVLADAGTHPCPPNDDPHGLLLAQSANGPFDFAIIHPLKHLPAD